MKKSFFLILTILLFSMVSKAQSNRYANENLSEVRTNKYAKRSLKYNSTEELELLMGKAKNLRKAGWITLGSGTVLFVTGLSMEESTYLIDEPSTKSKTGTAMAFVGISAILVGIPLLITGSTRVKKINKAFNGKVSFHLTSYNHKIPTINSHQYGLALNIKF